jgi:predicted nucleotidyltransferase
MTELTVTVPRDRIGALRRYAARLRKSNPAQREEVLWRLKHSLHELERFGVERLSLFGSVVRDTARRESDVDLLVEFLPGRPSGMLEFVELKHLLEGILQRPVDLVTPANLKPRIRDRILNEAVRIL